MQNADFLRELGHANYNRQNTIVQDANQRQIPALSDVVRLLLDRTVPILPRDRDFFRHHTLVIKISRSSRMSVLRKTGTLLSYCGLIPRLLSES